MAIQRYQRINGLSSAGPVSEVRCWKANPDGSKGKRLKDQKATIWDDEHQKAILLVERQ